VALQAQSKWDNSFDRPWPKLPPKVSHCTLIPNPTTQVAVCKPASAPPTNG
jgi:hypothetical protein